MLIVLIIALWRRIGMENDLRRRWRVIYGLLMIFFSACAPALTVPPVKMESRQAIVVRTADWNVSAAVLQAYEKEVESSSWVAVGKKIPAVVGRNGLGWGAGLHPRADEKSGPAKKEGDGKAPAGIFRLGSAFGYDPSEMTGWIRIPYQQMTATMQCVDDGRSSHYNRIVDAGRFKPDWSGGEEMLRKDDLYRLGIEVDHNVNPVVAGSGSCIFLHIWGGPLQGTAGCTAMDGENMEMLLLWLVPEAKPILVQLPEEEYARVREPWGLP